MFCTLKAISVKVHRLREREIPTMTLWKPPPACLSAASSLSSRLVPRFFFLRTPTKCRCCSLTLNGGRDVLNQSIANTVCKRWVTVERNIPPPSHFSFSLAKQHKKRTKTFLLLARFSWKLISQQCLPMASGEEKIFLLSSSEILQLSARPESGWDCYGNVKRCRPVISADAGQPGSVENTTYSWEKKPLTTAELQPPLVTERGGRSLKTQACVEEKWSLESRCWCVLGNHSHIYSRSLLFVVDLRFAQWPQGKQRWRHCPPDGSWTLAVMEMNDSLSHLRKEADEIRRKYHWYQLMCWWRSDNQWKEEIIQQPIIQSRGFHYFLANRQKTVWNWRSN